LKLCTYSTCHTQLTINHKTPWKVKPWNYTKKSAEETLKEMQPRTGTLKDVMFKQEAYKIIPQSVVVWDITHIDSSHTHTLYKHARQVTAVISQKFKSDTCVRTNWRTRRTRNYNKLPRLIISRVAKDISKIRNCRYRNWFCKFVL